MGQDTPMWGIERSSIEIFSAVAIAQGIGMARLQSKFEWSAYFARFVFLCAQSIYLIVKRFLSQQLPRRVVLPQAICVPPRTLPITARRVLQLVRKGQEVGPGSLRVFDRVPSYSSRDGSPVQM